MKVDLDQVTKAPRAQKCERKKSQAAARATSPASSVASTEPASKKSAPESSKDAPAASGSASTAKMPAVDIRHLPKEEVDRRIREQEGTRWTTVKSRQRSGSQRNERPSAAAGSARQAAAARPHGSLPPKQKIRPYDEERRDLTPAEVAEQQRLARLPPHERLEDQLGSKSPHRSSSSRPSYSAVARSASRGRTPPLQHAATPYKAQPPPTHPLHSSRSRDKKNTPSTSSASPVKKSSNPPPGYTGRPMMSLTKSHTPSSGQSRPALLPTPVSVASIPLPPGPSGSALVASASVSAPVPPPLPSIPPPPPPPLPSQQTFQSADVAEALLGCPGVSPAQIPAQVNHPMTESYRRLLDLGFDVVFVITPRFPQFPIVHANDRTRFANAYFTPAHSFLENIYKSLDNFQNEYPQP